MNPFGRPRSDEPSDPADRVRIVRPVPDRRLRRQRREPRYAVPTYSVQIQVEVFVGDQRYTGLLWDISRSGACVRSFTPIPFNCHARVRFHKHASQETIECESELIWSDAVMRAYFTGLHFDEPITSTQTFLSQLLEIIPPKPDRRDL